MSIIVKNVVTFDRGVVIRIKTVIGKGKNANKQAEDKAIEILMRYIYEAVPGEPDKKVIAEAVKKRSYADGNFEISILDSDEVEEI